MKVIAKTAFRTFLVEASVEELDALAGVKVGSDDYHGYQNHREIVLGTTFNICEAWRRLHRDAQRKNDVEIVRQQLQALILGLNIIGPLIEEPETKTEEVQP